MTDIPEDIHQKAVALCRLLEAMPSDGNIAAIEQALMEERERCAKIAEHFAQQWDKGVERGSSNDGFNACWQVADAIRTP